MWEKTCNFAICLVVFVRDIVPIACGSQPKASVAPEPRWRSPRYAAIWAKSLRLLDDRVSAMFFLPIATCSVSSVRTDRSLAAGLPARWCVSVGWER